MCSPGLNVFLTVRRLCLWRQRPRLTFTAVSAAACLLPTALYYGRYGWEFLWEAYLYHFARTDHREPHSHPIRPDPRRFQPDQA